MDTLAIIILETGDNHIFISVAASVSALSHSMISGTQLVRVDGTEYFAIELNVVDARQKNV